MDGERVLPGKAADAPGVGHESGCDAEADNVGKGIELHAEFGGGAGHAGDAAVEGIEKDGKADGFGGAVKLIEATRKRGHTGIVATEQIGHGEHAGKQENPAAEFRATEAAFLERNFLLLEFSHAMSASPPVTDFLPRKLVFACCAVALTLRAAASTRRRWSRPLRGHPV